MTVRTEETSSRGRSETSVTSTLETLIKPPGGQGSFLPLKCESGLQVGTLTFSLVQLLHWSRLY